MTAQPDSPTRLFGKKLWLARLVWAIVVFLVAAVLNELIPVNMRYTYSEWLVTQARPILGDSISYWGFVRYLTVLETIVATVTVLTGLVIFRYKHDDWMGLFVSATLIMLSLLAISSNVDTWTLPRWLRVIPFLANLLRAIVISSFLLFFYLFPDGRFTPRWTRWTAVLGLVGIASFTLLPELQVIRINREQYADYIWGVFGITMLVSLIIAIGTQVHRYRSAGIVKRQQMKWVIIGLGAWFANLILGFLVGQLLGASWNAFIGLQFELISLALIPITIGFAILRYRLWDVDLWINRTVVYGGLTLLVTALYALTVGGTAILFQPQTPITGIVVAVIIIGLTLPPVYLRWQALVNQFVPMPRPPSSPLAKKKPAEMPSGTLLDGRFLLVARLIWGVVTLFSLVVFMASIKVALVSNLFTRMPQLAAEIDVALFSVFANNQLLANDALLFISYVQFLLFLILGLIIFWRRSNDWMAILASVMLISTGAGFSPAVFFLPIFRPLWHIPVSLLQAVLFTTLLWFLYLFPNGRFVPAWTRWAALLWGIYATGWLIWPELNPHRAGNFTALLIFIAWAWSGVMAQLYRFRQANGLERQQQKWVMIGFFLTHLFFGLLVVSSASGLNRQLLTIAPKLVGLLNALFGLSAILIPITMAFAILHYRLWEVDLILNRTLVYGGLTAGTLTLYGLSVGILTALMPGQTNLLISFIAFGTAAVAIIPTRRLLQRQVDQWLPTTSPSPPIQPVTTPQVSTTGPLWRLAHIAWVTLFVFLFWQLVLRLLEINDILAAIGEDYLVSTSLQLFPKTAVSTFAGYVMALRIGTTAVFWVTAVLIFWRKRTIWFALYVSFLLMLFPFVLLWRGDVHPLIMFMGFLSFGAQLSIPFLFPDGRFIPRSNRWRIILSGIGLLSPFALYPIISLALPNYDPGEWAYATVMFSMAVIVVAGLVSQIYRYRCVADALQRQQMKWVLVGLGIGFLWLFWLVLWLSGILEQLNLSEPATALVMLHFTILASAALPITIGFSILRYRLWQVDVFINRALVFGGLTLLVTAVYFLVIGILGFLFQAGGNVLLSILATGMIAILFNPLRQRLQRAVNRLMYGERDDPITALSRLGKRLEETSDPAEILPTLIQTIAHTLKLPYTAVALRDGSDFPIIAEYSHVATPLGGEAEVIPLVYQSELVGQLLVAPRAPKEPFTPADRRLLENIARQAGTAVHAVQLTADLQRSREHLIAAREEERRRLRRDLHDGLGPQLASLTLKIDAARNYLHQNPEASDQLLLELKDEVKTAIGDIRRVAYNLRPPALDQLGLVSALREHAASQNGHHSLQVDIRAPSPLPPLPAAVEVAAYRIALEAMTNVSRHAQAKNCTINLTLNGGLQLEIIDDGRGLPAAYAAGVGLASMRERATELGGSFTIETLSQGGTAVRVNLPFSQMEASDG